MSPDDKPKWKHSWDNPESNLVVDYELIHDITILKRSEMLSILQNYAEFPKNEDKVFLDLGAGRGAASFSILNKYTDAKAILIDGSESMLYGAKKEAEQRGYRIQTIYQDLSDPNWISKAKLKEKYPLIISSIMIHHLTDDQKAQFFKDIYSLLLPSGIFLYADAVRMETEIEEKISMDLWVKEIIKNKIAKKVTPKSLEEEKQWIFNETEKQGDMPAKITFILNSLQQAGFREETMIWFYIKFAVFLAKK